MDAKVQQDLNALFPNVLALGITTEDKQLQPSNDQAPMVEALGA